MILQVFSNWNDSKLNEPVMQYGSSSHHFSSLLIAGLGMTKQAFKWDFVLWERFPVIYRRLLQNMKDSKGELIKFANATTEWQRLASKVGQKGDDVWGKITKNFVFEDKRLVFGWERGIHEGTEAGNGIIQAVEGNLWKHCTWIQAGETLFVKKMKLQQLMQGWSWDFEF